MYDEDTLYDLCKLYVQYVDNGIARGISTLIKDLSKEVMLRSIMIDMALQAEESRKSQKKLEEAGVLEPNSGVVDYLKGLGNDR